MQFCPECASPLVRRIIGGAERSVCTARGCHFIHWNNPTPVVAGIVKLGDQYILARNAAWPDYIYSMITGFLEAGEDPETAIMRETQEELGLIATEVKFIGHFIYEKRNQLLLAYLVKAQGTIKLNEELTDYKLLTHEELEIYNFEPLKLTATIVKQLLLLES
ncbi:NUDIX domain-containing protein [Thiofilum flexile]|uniref:NUDIX domain-containing protein n=1 Tax=Thiofilum flexile TaxID=125627 RepID=UPI00036C3B43|nr:NUDIX domain-containing protein [Thiofilum flexile]